jgi:hypothetical protein
MSKSGTNGGNRAQEQNASVAEVSTPSAFRSPTRYSSEPPHVTRIIAASIENVGQCGREAVTDQALWSTC